MRIPLDLLILVCVICPATDFYIWRVLGHQKSHPRRWQAVHLAIALICYLLMGIALMMPRRGGDERVLTEIMWMLFTVLSIYVPKLIFVVIDILGQLPRIFRRKRIKAVRILATALSLITFAMIWYGALVNRFRLDVNEVDVNVPALPKSFDGLKMVQISDLHLASFGSDTTFTSRLVDRINSLEPDVIVFTGDIVSRRTEELLPHIAPLSRLKAPMGVYAILGNHDYGDYYSWPSKKAKRQNMQRLYQAFQDMGWDLLLDRTSYLTRGTDSVALIGVENIGDPPYHVYGSLKRAYPRGADGLPKILLSHNPAHWDKNLADKSGNDIGLTLSGHTHAMQMELLGQSPASMVYPRWGGLYSDSHGRQLYVNIGTGTVGLPMRIGATPEITLLTLHPAPPVAAR